jgi:hypothetical protein
MTRRTLFRAAAPLLALLASSTAAGAAEPFHGFFRPRGGELYSPLHYWSPAGYKVKYHCIGPECHGAPVSVCPPVRPAYGPVVVTPAAAPPQR